ncbi:B12-binding domain-containing radical SAM protein [Wukongibacter sp. M2B1]|uniref:B12-binding domain-containing radical SAM protein n=1 Tax=Wukongibacter sp. M2B1 TaxID=3088895 RepID=UPI003D7ADFDE
MNILLVDGVFNFTAQNYEPIGIGYIAAALRDKNYSVEVFEPCLEGLSIEETISSLSSKLLKFDLIGISIMSIADKKDLIELREFVNRIRNEGYIKHITIGGHGASIEFDKILKTVRDIDSVIVGEGEETICELVEEIKRDGDLNRIDGLAYLSNNEVIFNNKRKNIENLDKIPFMARDILERRLEFYGSDYPVTIISSRGCFGKCTFCSVVPYLNLTVGKRYRLRSIKNVVDEIQYLVNKYGVSRFYFLDENFILPGKQGFERAKELNNEIKKRDISIKYHVLTRVDSIYKETILLLKESGMVSVFLGVESFHDDDLKLFNKRVDVNKVEHSLKILKECGFSTEVESKYRARIGYIAFHPYSTLDSIKQGISFFRKYKIPFKKFLRPLEVFEGTEIYDNFKNKSILLDVKKNTPMSIKINKVTYPVGFKFLDVRVESIYANIINYYNCIHPLREKIRTIEKLIANSNSEEVLKITKFRKDIDQSFFNIMEVLLDAAEKNRRDLNQITDEYISSISDLMMELDIQKMISKIAKTAKISEKVWGMQWPTRV